MGLLDSSENSFGSRFNCFFFFLVFFLFIWSSSRASPSRLDFSIDPVIIFRAVVDVGTAPAVHRSSSAIQLISLVDFHWMLRAVALVALGTGFSPHLTGFQSFLPFFWFYWILLICIGWNGAKMALPGFTQFKQAWQGLFYSFFTLSDWHLKDVFKDSLCFTVYFKFSHLNRIMIIPYWAQTNFTEDLNCFPGCDLFFVSNDNNAIQSEAESGRQIEWISRTCHHVLHLRSFVNCLRGRARN